MTPWKLAVAAVLLTAHAAVLFHDDFNSSIQTSKKWVFDADDFLWDAASAAPRKHVATHSTSALFATGSTVTAAYRHGRLPRHAPDREPVRGADALPAEPVADAGADARAVAGARPRPDAAAPDVRAVGAAVLTFLRLGLVSGTRIGRAAHQLGATSVHQPVRVRTPRPPGSALSHWSAFGRPRATPQDVTRRDLSPGGPSAAKKSK